MKKLIKASLALLLAMILAVPAFTFSVSAAGQVYTIDGTNHVFLGAGETVSADLVGNDGVAEEYNTYSTLKDAIAAIATGGGVVAIVGEFTDPTNATNADSTFSDTSGRGAITIKGIGDGAILNFAHTLKFVAPISFYNFKLVCTATNGKYLMGGGDTLFGEGFTTEGKILYSNVDSTTGLSAKTVFNAPGAHFTQMNSSSYNKGTEGTTGTYELIFNDIGFTDKVNINLGAINGTRNCYGNVNLYVNGGTFVGSPEVTINYMAEGMPTGRVSVVFNNGMASSFGNIAAGVDYVIKSGENGKVSIKTQATASAEPTFALVPDDGYVPTVDGVILPANSDGEYLISPTAADTTQTFMVSYVVASGEEAQAAYYSINGAKTGFVKAGGGAVEYNGISVIAFDTVKSALAANTNKADVTLVVVGVSTQENLSYANSYPTNLLTITGADENAVLKLSANAHPWGNVLFENIALECTGSFCSDGNKVIFGEGVTGTLPTPLWGGGASSDHGGNLEIHSGTWDKITVGSNAATSSTSAKTQSHNLAVYGGDFTTATIDFGSTVSTTVPKNMIFTVGGGTFAENQEIYASNVTEIGGVSAVIYNNGMADNITLTLPAELEYVIKSGKNGAVSFDGTQFVVTPDDGYAAIVDGELSLTNVIAVDETKEHTVTYIKATGKEQAYDIDGISTAFVKKGGGVFKLDEDGNAFYAYDDIKQAVIAAMGGRVLVIGEYSGSLTGYWGGTGDTVITGYDENAVLTLSAFYMWTPIIFENIKISGSSATFNADSRPVVFGEGVEVVGNGLTVYGSSSAATRATNVTLKSGKYAKVIGGNIGSNEALSISLKISGGDYTGATINLGNDRANTLNGNAILELSGGTFSDGQEIKYDNLTTNGNAIAIVTNNVDTAYNLVFSENLDYVFKIRDGGTYTLTDAGSDTSAPTLVFAADTEGYAPLVNGTQLMANGSGIYEYTPEISDTMQSFEITWAVDTTPRVYLVDEISTVFVSAEESVTVGETVYYPFDTLTEAVAALGGNEGKVIIAGNVDNSYTVDSTKADTNAFVDTAGRKPIIIEGLTGNEVFTINGTFGFKGDVTLDKFTLQFSPKSLGAKYFHGFGNLTIGKDFKVDDTNGAKAYFAPLFSTGVLDKDITVTACGGTFAAFHGIGAYKAVPADTSITNIIDGAILSGTLNMGYSESRTSGNNISYVKGAVNLIINTDTVTNKTISLTESKNSSLDLSDGVFTLVFNNGITGYTITDAANNLLDYIVYTGIGGEATVYENGTTTAAPTFLLTPDDGYTPKINGVFIEEVSGKYLYTPEFTGEQTTFNVEWIDESTMVPVVYEENDGRYAYVKDGGGVIYSGNEVKFAYADINSAVAALGTSGGNVKVYGNVLYVCGGTYETNLFADVVGRSKVTITGIEGTEPCVTYYQNAKLEGDLEVDNIKFHRLTNASSPIYDTGFVTKGHELILGENLVTTTDFSQNMTIHGVSGDTLEFSKPQVITIKGGTITRVVPGTTWAASTVTGDSVINISGGVIDSVFGGSHGGQNTNSIINGDTTINISGGKIVKVYSGGNSKSVLNGNVVVNVSGGNFNSTGFYHGNYTDIDDNKLSGNSAFVFSGGTYVDALFGDGSSRGVTGEEIFIINNTLSGFTVSPSDKGTVIYYDPDGTVEPAFDESGAFIGYEILCDIEGIDIVIDGEKVTRTENNIYSIARGEHTVLFSTLWDVEFDLNGAEGMTPETIQRYNDAEVTLTAPEATKKNHYFNGWSTDANAEIGSLTYTVPNEASTLYAIWTEIKPEETENSNIENSDASAIVIASVGESEYDTHASVLTAKAAAENDVVLGGGYSVVYAFTIRAFDSENSAVSDFVNGIHFRIPKYVLPERVVGEFYRIYKTAPTGNVSLASDETSVVAYTEDEDYLYFTDYSTGDYTVALAAADYADYLYKGVYDSVQGKYTLVLTFGGASASFGSFGLKYDTDKLTLDSFTFSEEVTDIGSVSVAEGGFGTYYNANGIYQNTWTAADGVSIEAEENPVTIGTFVFTVAEGFALSDGTFASASVSDTGIELDDGTLETVYSDGFYLYAPCIPSAEVYCQPVNVSFDTGVVKRTVNASYRLARESIYSFINNTETGYNNAAQILITDASGTVFSTSEDKLTIESDENGMAVVVLAAALEDGTYSITFTKNGYVTTKTEFEVAGGNVDLGVITPVCGDIKGDFSLACGDGLVDIDDFIRVLRGFNDKSGEKLREAVDLNESGLVDVTDLSIIKKGMTE